MNKIEQAIKESTIEPTNEHHIQGISKQLYTIKGISVAKWIDDERLARTLDTAFEIIKNHLTTLVTKNKLLEK